jgi:ADP-heptose:LPS heptosyltransferase
MEAKDERMRRGTLEQTVPSPHAPSSERILVLAKGGIGDVVFTLPLLEDLRAGFPRAWVVTLSHAQGQGILRHAPAVDEARSDGPLGHRAPVRASVEALGKDRFTLALTPVRSLRAAWLLWRSGAPIRVGFDGGPEGLLYTHRAPVRPFEVVFSRRFERLASALGVATGATGRLRVSEPERARAAERLRAGGWRQGPLVALHVGGGWPTKQWPVEHARALVSELAGRGQQTLLVGGAQDAARAQAIGAGATLPTVDRTGTPVAEAVAELALAGAAVGLDSGLSHAGVALGVRTVLLFGPNDPASVLPHPWTRIVTQPLACRPCNRAGKRACPERHHRCMRDTTAGQVLDALDALGMGRATPGG